MNKQLLSCLFAGALATTLALASPALARGGGGGHGGGFPGVGTSVAASEVGTGRRRNACRRHGWRNALRGNQRRSAV